MKRLLIYFLLLNTIITTSLFAEAPFVTNALSMVEMQKLIASDAATGDSFGHAVAICGDIAVIGAPNDGAGRGAAYVYQFNPVNVQYEEIAKFTAFNPSSDDRFGNTVAIDGDTIIVGASGYDGYNGAVFVFVKPPAGWESVVQSTKLTLNESSYGSFGASLAIKGDTVVVGSPDTKVDERQ